jgi:hypothetical protein
MRPRYFLCSLASYCYGARLYVCDTGSPLGPFTLYPLGHCCGGGEISAMRRGSLTQRHFVLFACNGWQYRQLGALVPQSGSRQRAYIGQTEVLSVATLVSSSREDETPNWRSSLSCGLQPTGLVTSSLSLDYCDNRILGRYPTINPPYKFLVALDLPVPDLWPSSDRRND